MSDSAAKLGEPSPEPACADLGALEWIEASEVWDEVPDDIALLVDLQERDEMVLAAERAWAAEDAVAPMTGWTDQDLADEAARAERAVRWATAQGLRVAAEMAARHPEESRGRDERGLSAFALDEIAVAAGITRGSACIRVAEGQALTQRHPLLLAALAAGCLALPAVRAVLLATEPLDADGCARVERALLKRAGRPEGIDLGAATAEELMLLPVETVAAISARATSAWAGKTARTLAARIDPEAAAARETRAKSRRSVRLEPGTDGMAWLVAHLPRADAEAAYDHIDALARVCGPTDGEASGGPTEDDPRGIDEKRADALVDLVLGSSTASGDPLPAAPVNVHLLVDATREPEGAAVGEGGRLGPVTAATVRELLALSGRTGGSVTTSFAQPQPCPGPQVHAEQGPGPYEPPERLKDLIRVRHRQCTFPGCGRASRRCDVDHRVRYPDGPTCECNLHPLCRHHHLLKHHAAGWQVLDRGGGRLTWVTPSSRRIPIDPHGREAPDFDP